MSPTNRAPLDAMASAAPFAFIVRVLVLAAVIGCGNEGDDLARTPTPNVEVIVEEICLFDPAGLTPTICTVFPTRTPTPTPIYDPAKVTMSCFSIDHTPIGPCPTRTPQPQS